MNESTPFAGEALSLCVAAVLVATSCSNGSQSSSSTSSSSASSVTVTGPCLSATSFPARPAGVISAQPVWTILANLSQPDDLLFHDGSLYVGELGAGKIHVVTAGRSPSVLPVTIPKVEGMVFVNSVLYAADQQDDRVDVVQGASVKTLLQLQPVAGQDGVDSIGAINGTLLVPDSPRGVLDWVDTSGRIVRTVGGFVRPTGVWPLASGTILVADEFGNSAIALNPDGSRDYVLRGLPIVDDVAADSKGGVFVVTPAVNAGRMAEVVAHTAQDLATGLAAPQGLAFDNADNVYVSEFDAGRVDLVIRSFKIAPIGPARPAAGRPLCVDVERAAGFRAPVTLTGDGVTVVTQPELGARGEVLLGSSCRPTNPCTITATSGSLSDTIQIAG